MATLLVVGMAVALATPLAIAIGVFLSEIAPPAARAVAEPTLQLLAGIPAVVYGFVGYATLVPLMERWLPTGETLICAAVILALMVLPFIAATAAEVLLAGRARAAPRRASRSGVSRWYAFSRITLRKAAPGVLAGVILGMGRGLGETLAVLMLSGNSPVFPDGLTSRGQPLTALIATDLGESAIQSDRYHALFSAGLLLMADGDRHQHRSSCSSSRGSSVQDATELDRRRAPLARAAHGVAPRTDASDALYRAVAWIAGGIGVLLPVAILAYLAWHGLAALTPEFLFSRPRGSSLDGKGGIWPAIKGSLALVGLGLVPALILGIGGGIYLAEFNRSPRLERVARFCIESLAAVPGLVYSLFGYALLVVTFNFKISLIAGAVTLGFVMLPLVLIGTHEALRAVDPALREAAHALGVSHAYLLARVRLAGGLAGDPDRDRARRGARARRRRAAPLHLGHGVHQGGAGPVQAGDGAADAPLLRHERDRRDGVCVRLGARARVP